jgi:hypothetical protein
MLLTSSRNQIVLCLAFYGLSKHCTQPEVVRIDGYWIGLLWTGTLSTWRGMTRHRHVVFAFILDGMQEMPDGQHYAGRSGSGCFAPAAIDQ